MNDDLGLIVVADENKHLGVMGAEGVGHVGAHEPDIRVPFGGFLGHVLRLVARKLSGIDIL